MSYDPVDFARQNIKYFVDKEEPDPESFSRVNYIMRGDGLWEVRKNKVGSFTVHKCKGNIAGFPDDHSFEEGFDLTLPKIPRKMLDQIVAFFRKLTESHDFEAYIQIFWSPKEEEYFLFCPKQLVSKGRVEYKPSELIAENVLVCEIHSHNSMQAFFSPTDDADEKQRGDRFFGVIGKLDTLSPQIKLSFIIGGGKRVFVELEDLFQDESFPVEWLEQISYVDHKKNPEFARQATGQRKAHWQGNSDRHFQNQQEMFEGLRDEYDFDFGEEEEEEDGEDVYDNMELVSIDEFSDMTGDELANHREGNNDNMRDAINNMLASQGIVGSESEA